MKNISRLVENEDEKLGAEKVENISTEYSHAVCKLPIELSPDSVYSEYTSFSTKSPSKHLRWIILFLACILLMGNYYCYDIPAAINTQLGEYLELPYYEWQVKMNSLYTAYSLPNLVMPLVGGILIDSMGATRMLISFGVLTLFGQAVFSIGISSKSFWVMALGRVLFGIGGESLEVAQARITTDWFHGNFLGLALGLNLTSARVATALNDFISPLFTSPVIAGWFGAVVCFISLFSAILISYNGHYRRKPPSDEVVPESFYETNNIDEEQTLLQSSHEDLPDIINDEKLHWTDLKKLPLSFWLLCLCCMALYGAVNPFIHVLSDFFQKKYGMDAKSASALMSIPDLVSAVGSPLGGLLIDKLSHRNERWKNLKSYLLPFSGLLLMFTHYLIGFTEISPIFPLINLGIAYSLFGATLWPLVPHFVEEKKILGTAYGVSTVALNIALATGPLVVAELLTRGGYALVEKYFLASSSVGLVLGLAIASIDSGYFKSGR